MWVVPWRSVGYRSPGISTAQSSYVWHRGHAGDEHPPGVEVYGFCYTSYDKEGIKQMAPFYSVFGVFFQSLGQRKIATNPYWLGVELFYLFFSLLFSLTVHPLLLICRVVVGPTSGLLFHPGNRGLTFLSYLFSWGASTTISKLFAVWIQYISGTFF